MVYTSTELRECMDKRNNIRNMSVIGHFSHGKSTLVDSLVEATGIDRKGVSMDVHMTHTRPDEAQRSISIKSTGISLLYDMDNKSLEDYKGERDGNKYLINLLDSPGHVEFSSEVTAALRITDGTMLIVDCVEGLSVQTETLLQQALGERVKPVLCLNKMDKLFPGLQLDSVKSVYPGEHAYNILYNAIENANHIMAANKDEWLGDVEFCPRNGNVAFSSGLHDWAFTLTDIAKMCASKFGIEESIVIEKIWGDHFYIKTTNTWTKENIGPRKCVRGFLRFCYNPIQKIINACMSDDKVKLWNLCKELGVRMSDDEKKLSGVALVKCVMQTWLPASTALFGMAISHLPSPSEAQKYRVEKLYEGPLDDIYAQAIGSCDPKGPLMLYVSKMIPSAEVGRFFALGRVFSGRIANNMKVRIMGPSYIPSMSNDLYVTTVQHTFIWMGRSHDGVEDIPCGNTVCMTGLEEFITKSATLTNEEEVDAWPVRAMKFCVSPVVYVTVECKVIKDIPELVEGLKHLAKSDLIVLCSAVKSRSCTIAGTGELHLEIFLNDLRGVFMDGSKINISLPEIPFCETILGKCGPQEYNSRNKRNSVCLWRLAHWMRN
uniref:Uncharacterized protein n=1 Tax=Avena sativa TaxID=4498 RepID=A0ACD5WBE4_AVESA